jgi:tRNA threonylcarbamoyladenosine biosynthesis protein TsaB
MITLGIDTTGKTLAVAVLRGDTPVAELLLSTGYRHGVTLQPSIEYVLGQADFRVKDVDLFAVTTGPGSFTGIRIGLSSVKSMAYAVGAKAVLILLAFYIFKTTIMAYYHMSNII